MDTATYTLPAHWASALINGDTSGMDDADELEMNGWLVSMPHLGECLGCNDEVSFCTHNDAGTLAGDCLEFTFPVNFTRNGELIYPAIVKTEPMAHHLAGLQWTATGYTAKLSPLSVWCCSVAAGGASIARSTATQDHAGLISVARM